MTTIKSYTNLEQSKKLAEILPLESADMHNEAIEIDGDMVFVVIFGLGDKNKSNYGSPIWSLAALLNVLPKIHNLKPLLDLEENSIMYSGTYTDVTADNPVDACVEMLLKLNTKVNSL